MSGERKVLIVVPNYTNCIEANYNYSFPLGIGYIIGTLLESGFSLDVLNLNHLHGTSAEILEIKLDENNYPIVATGGNTLLFNELKTIVATVNKHKSKPVTILGGPIITTEPEIIYDAIAPDYGVLGEGEVTIVKLVTKILKNQNKVIDGTIYRESDKIKIAPTRDFIADLDSITFPDINLLEYEKRLNNIPFNSNYDTGILEYPRVYSLIGNRGCPFKCTFCFHHLKYRERSINNIFEELDSVVEKYKINYISLNDDCFSLKTERVKEFCARINELRKDIDWDLQWGCQLTVKGITRELLKTLKDSGCSSISYGFESFSLEVLKSMKKPISPDEIDNAIKLTQEAGIMIQGNFIFGDLTETIETAATTLSYWKNKCNGQIQLGMIQLFPGSEIYKYSKDHGIIPDPLEFITKLSADNSINFSKHLSDREYKQLHEYIRYSQERYMHPVCPKILLKDENNRYTLKIKCPICKKSFIVKNFYIKNILHFYNDQRCRVCLGRFTLTGRHTRLKVFIKTLLFSLFKWSPLRIKLFFNKKFENK